MLMYKEKDLKDIMRTILQFVIGVSIQITPLDASQYCFADVFHPQCNDSEVIVVTSALYGRLDVGRCISTSEALGCYNNVMSFMDNECSGRQSCTIQVFELETQTSEPCPSDYKNYLEAEYTCETVLQEKCPINDSRTISFMPNTVATYSNRAGTKNCPWTIEALPGQHLVLELLDFTLSIAVNEVYDATNANCPIYVVIQEHGYEQELVYLCSISIRKRIVYTSHGHNMTFYMNINTTLGSEPYFLFTYRVKGCPYLVNPANSFMIADDKHAEVYCNSTGETWFLVCSSNSQWLGTMGNCSEENNTTGTDGDSRFPYVTTCPNIPEEKGGKNILIAVAIGVGVGVAVGLIMLGIVLGVMKCCKKKKTKQKVPDLSSIAIPNQPPKEANPTGEPQPGPSREYTEPYNYHPNEPLPHRGHITFHPNEPIGHIPQAQSDPNFGHDPSFNHTYPPPHEHGYPIAHEQAMTISHGFPVPHPEHNTPKKNMYPSLDRVRNLRQQQQVHVEHHPHPVNYEVYDVTKSLDRKVKQAQFEMQNRGGEPTYDGKENLRY